MNRIVRVLDNIEEYFVITMLFSMVVLIFLQIIFRFAFDFSLSWTEEAARYCFVSLVVVAASLAAKHNRHLKVAALQELLPPKISFCFWLLATLVWSAFNITIVLTGYPMALTILSSGQSSPVLNIPMGALYLIIPTGYLLLQIRVSQVAWREWKPRLYRKPGQALEF